MRIVTEDDRLRVRIADDLGWATSDAPASEGLLLGRPHAGSAVGDAAWVLYESGDIVLRRSRHHADAEQAACFHLLALEAAVMGGLLPLRLRTIVLPDGGALLVEAAPIHNLAGHDRRLAGRGYLVLPTTIAAVDPASGSVVLPQQRVDASVPSGARRIERILLRDGDERAPDGAAQILAIARNLVRTPDTDLDVTLAHIDRLTRSHGTLIELLPGEAIAEQIHALGAPPQR